MYRKCIGSDPTAARLDFALYEVAGVLPGFASTATRDAGAAVFTWRCPTRTGHASPVP